MLALKDKDGVVESSLDGLADAAKLTPDECRSALDVLMATDEGDSSGVDQGRRLRKVPGGWQIVNHDLYRFSTPERREFWRQQKAEQRAKAEAKLKKTNKKHTNSNNGEPKKDPMSQDEDKQVRQFADGTRPIEKLGDPE